MTTGADIDTDELVDETGVDPKDIELVTLQVRPARLLRVSDSGVFWFLVLISVSDSGFVLVSPRFFLFFFYFCRGTYCRS